ncbi:MFS transporter [Fodinicola acaciae]|uniref:MFS transporter n=1 Tax=Fodinicola acaciae TaxID=2681555 RepID=UPI0013D2BFBF|nr:MFS transporter [Fodinicola acaciae]
MTVAAPVRSVYRDRQYVRYSVSQAVSILGDQVWYLALSWSATQASTPAVAGVVVSISALPRLAFMLLGGPLVDRYGPRRLMIGSDTLRAIVAASAAGVALWQPTIGLLVVVALVYGAVDAVFLPANGAMQPLLLEPSQFSSGAAFREITQRAALTVGAPLGGILVATGGLPLACVVDAATFVFSALALRSVRSRPVERKASEPYGRALREGFHYLATHRVLRASMLVGFLSNVGFVGPMNMGLTLLAVQHGWGATGAGLLLAGFGVGAAISAFAMLRLRIRRRVGLAFAIMLIAEGCCLLFLALSPNLALAVLVCCAVGVGSGMLGVTATALNQHVTDDRFRGRVGSVNSLANLGITPLAIAATAAAVGAFGVVPTFAGSTAVELAGAAVCLLVPELRRASM